MERISTTNQGIAQGGGGGRGKYKYADAEGRVEAISNFKQPKDKT